MPNPEYTTLRDESVIHAESIIHVQSDYDTAILIQAFWCNYFAKGCIPI